MSDFELSLDWLKVVVWDEIYALWVFERARNANFTERLGNDLVSTCFPLFLCCSFLSANKKSKGSDAMQRKNDDVGYLIIISTKEEFAREKVILKCDTLVNSKKTSVMLHGIMTHYCDKQQESSFCYIKVHCPLLYTGIEHPLSSIYVKGRNCPCVSVCLRV